jgi:hypothetical protein
VKFGEFFYMETDNRNEMKPQNILLKLSWATSIKILNNKERSDVFCNIFNYHTGEDLLPMSKTAQLFFSSAVEVFDYNINKYQQTVEKNRINGSKGGRPKFENPNNPIGYSNIPENPKEKDIEKDKIIDRDTFNDKEKSNDTIKEEDILILNKFKILAELNPNNISDSEGRFFIIEVKSLVAEVGWDKFYQLILGSTQSNVLDLISIFEIQKLEGLILDIRKHFNYYLDKLVN